MPLLEVRNLTKYFPIKKGVLSRTLARCVPDGVSFTLEKGKTLGLVGESGCGKTTVGRSLLRLVEPTSGEVIVNGKTCSPWTKRNSEKCGPLCRSFSRTLFISWSSNEHREIIAEPIRNHLQSSRSEIRDRVAYLMDQVGLHADQMNRYPHEFSGGQSRGSALPGPGLESAAHCLWRTRFSPGRIHPGSVMNLLAQLQEQMDLSYLFIATTWAWWSTSAIASRSCTWGGLWSWLRIRTSTTSLLSLHSGAPLRVPVPDPDIHRRGSSSKGMCRAPSILQAGVPSIPVVLLKRMFAAESDLNSQTWQRPFCRVSHEVIEYWSNGVLEWC